MTNIHELTNLGQSIWLDYIRRAFIITGEMDNVIKQGVRGVTSNPSIFEKAMAGSSDYDWPMEQFVAEGKSVPEIYEALAISDIQQAADLLRPVYEESDGKDGYVSLEVSPTLANNTERTIAEAKRLFAALHRPNVMIKIPATPAGIPAIEATIGAGINVNVTLIFSISQYEAVVAAYLSGLEQLAEAGGDVSQVVSVASFFVSRVDGKVDAALDEAGNTNLQGRIAIDNARLAYARFKELFSGPRWQALADQGANVQRPLWASTSVKNPAYPDTLYVDSLIGPHTVNTVPPETLKAFLDHGTPAPTIENDLPGARDRLAQLEKLGIDLAAISQTLQEEGVVSFAKAFESLMASIEEKRDRLQQSWQPMSASLGYETSIEVAEALNEVKEERLMDRIWAHDPTVWPAAGANISARLEWLHSPGRMKAQLGRLQELTETLFDEGYRHALLLGKGDSILTSALLRQIFDPQNGHLNLNVIDSADPDTIKKEAQSLDPAETVYLIAARSAEAADMLSAFEALYKQTAEAVGGKTAGLHFIAITDSGSKLEGLAEAYHFREIFLDDPHLSGRYATLSYEGLVPAALLGLDLERLLDRALEATYNSEECNCLVEGDNNSARLGVILGNLARQGRDKVTVVASPAIARFGEWLVPLLAKNGGKAGLGLHPIVGEALGQPEEYGADRLFVYLRLDGDQTHDAAVEALAEAGQPVVTLALRDLYDLGGQFFTWQMATALAGARLGVNPFG